MKLKLQIIQIIQIFQLRGVGVNQYQSDAKPVMRYEPVHPDGNEAEDVVYPDINPVIEMVDFNRGYERSWKQMLLHLILIKILILNFRYIKYVG